MSFLDIFRPLKKSTIQKWKEMGTYQATFSVFSGDVYSSNIVRSCIRPLAEFSSKASAKCTDKSLERLLNNRPNIYMNGRDFIYKVRTLTEINNTCFIYIQRDNRAKVVGFYPVPYAYFEAIEYMNGLFIKFYFNGDATRDLTLAWDDLAVIRKDYNKSDLAGDDNLAIVNTIELMQTTNEGLANAIKSTANLRGILKSTKAMLAPADIKQQKDTFVRDYLNLDNDGGIASLDATQDFTPIQMSPLTATYEQKKDIRDDIYRYFGVNDNIVMSSMGADEIEAFYELKIEPFLVQLSTELTSKVFAGKALAYEQNFIVFEANKLQFASLDKKITMFRDVVLYGGMTINEWRLGCNMSPLPDGDTPIRRLDAAPVDEEYDEELEDEELEAEEDEEIEEDDEINAQFEALKKELGA